MKESYKVRPSQSPWPRVMRRVGQLAGRSVHRGTTGRCMELRKHLFCGGRPYPNMGKAIVMSSVKGEFDAAPTESTLWTLVLWKVSRGREATVTGFASQADELPGKWMELLKEILPRMSRVPFLWTGK